MSELNHIAFFTEYRYLLRLVSAAINNMPPKTPPQGINWQALWQIAQETAFAPILFYAAAALQKEERPPQAVYEKLYGALRRHAVNDRLRTQALKQLTDFCEANKIYNIPLKGSYIKNFYPQPEMRYMVDLDLLVHKDGIRQVDAFLTENGYTCVARGEVHNEYTNRQHITVEIHKKLIAQSKSNAAFFDTVWERAAALEENTYTRKMADTDFYVYMLEHCAHHFFHGGIAPRMLLDFYICNQKMLLQKDRPALAYALAQTGLTAFEKRMRTLAFDWFSKDGKGLSHDTLSLYIMQNGKMGTVKNIVLTGAAAMPQSGGKVSRSRYVLKKLFPPPAALRASYPALSKAPVLYPFLLPVVWLCRLKARGRPFRSAAFIKSLDREQGQIDSLREMMRQLEIDRYM